MCVVRLSVTTAICFCFSLQEGVVIIIIIIISAHSKIDFQCSDSLKIGNSINLMHSMRGSKIMVEEHQKGVVNLVVVVVVIAWKQMKQVIN